MRTGKPEGGKAGVSQNFVCDHEVHGWGQGREGTGDFKEGFSKYRLGGPVEGGQQSDNRRQENQ